MFHLTQFPNGQNNQADMRMLLFYLWMFCLPFQMKGQTEFIWSGALTSNSAKVTTKINSVNQEHNVAVVVSQKKSFRKYFTTDEYSARAENNYFVTVPLEGLEENTRYYYRFQIDGKIDDRDEATGTFKTFKDEPFSFKFVVSSCAKANKTYPAFYAIIKENPMFFMYTGDFHYGDVNSDCEKNLEYYFSSALKYRNVTHKEMPVAYIWDDHDYGPNNSDATSPCRIQAIKAFKTYVPHYDLPFNSYTDPVSQSFVAGNIKFIMPDLRSQKIKPMYNECLKLSTGTNFGSTSQDSTHLKWFFHELFDAKERGLYPVWVSGIPYIGDEHGPNYECDQDDDWSGFPEERKTIAEFIEMHQINLLIIAGDAHMVGIDDGTNSNYATEGKLKIPVFQASSLGGKKGSYKGGPYSHGYKPTPATVDDLDEGQFGIVEVKQRRNAIRIKLTGKDHNGKVLRNMEGKKLKYSYKVDL
jgi:hypothetical protein